MRKETDLCGECGQHVPQPVRYSVYFETADGNRGKLIQKNLDANEIGYVIGSALMTWADKNFSNDKYGEGVAKDMAEADMSTWGIWAEDVCVPTFIIIRQK